MSRGRKNVYVYTFYNDKQPVSWLRQRGKKEVSWRLFVYLF
jgi:hypothetical protein